MKKLTRGQKLFFAIIVLWPLAVVFNLYLRPMREIDDSIWRDVPVVAGMFFAPLMVGLLIYWFREHVRLIYGMLEVYLGFILTGKDALSVVDSITSVYISNTLFQTNKEYPDALVVIPMLIQVMAGIYVMVRGLDNIGQGLKGTKGEGIWSWVSLKPKRNVEPRAPVPDYPWKLHCCKLPTLDSAERN